MEIRFNVTGARRKELVTAISTFIGFEAVYCKAPTFAYVVNHYRIDKEGTLSCSDSADSAELDRLLSHLAEQGFVTEDMPSTTEEAESLAQPETSDTALQIEMPLEGFTDTALQNLERLVAGKAELIKKAVGADTLAIVRDVEKLCFPWFSSADSDKTLVYIQFITALCNTAKTQKRVVGIEKPAENEKYAMRCFLLRLGFIGEEYALARKVLLSNFTGSSSFKSGAKKPSPCHQTVPNGCGDTSVGIDL